MAKLLQTLIPLFTCFLMLASSTPHKLQSSSFYFDSFDPKPKNLVYQGGAHVPPGSTYLRLTKTDSSGNPTYYNVGRVLYSKPVHLWDKSSATVAAFQASIKFVITSRNSGRDSNDGLTFFIEPFNTPIPSGSSGGNLGIFNASGKASSLFAVEFDTYSDLFLDPRYHHIGIDINSRESKKYTKFESATGDEVTALINYEPVSGLISVIASSRSQYATLTYNFDLSKILPEWVQVGISSSTGFLSIYGISDVHSWGFTSSRVYIDNYKDTYIRQHVDV